MSNDQPDNLSWGARLCPLCKKHEVIRAAKCLTCYKREYSKSYYNKNRDKCIAQQKRWRDLRKARTVPAQDALKTMLGALLEQDKTIKGLQSLSSFQDLFALLKDGLHIHVHVHQEKNDERTAYINEEKAKDFIQTIIAEKKERAANDLKARSLETKPTVISQTERCDLPGCDGDHTVSSLLNSIKVI